MIDPIIDLVRDGGWVLVGIAFVSLIAWTLIFMEWIKLTERTECGWTEIEGAIQQLESGQDAQRSPLQLDSENLVAKLLGSEILTRRMNRSSFEAQVIPLWKSEEVLLRQTQHTISVLAACMPLLGLLGTVLGMIEMFQVLAVPGVVEADSMAGGISQALITTQAGLVIAVPVLLVNGMLGSRIRRYLDTSRMMVKKIETALCDEDI